MNKPIYIDSLPLIFPSGPKDFHKAQELSALILETHVVMISTTFWCLASKAGGSREPHQPSSQLDQFSVKTEKPQQPKSNFPCIHFSLTTSQFPGGLRQIFASASAVGVRDWLERRGLGPQLGSELSFFSPNF